MMQLDNGLHDGALIPVKVALICISVGCSGMKLYFSVMSNNR